MVHEELQQMFKAQEFEYKDNHFYFNNRELNDFYLNDYFKNCHTIDEFAKRIKEFKTDVSKNLELWT